MQLQCSTICKCKNCVNMMKGIVQLEIKKEQKIKKNIKLRDLTHIRNKVKNVVGVSGLNAPKKIEADLDLNFVNKIIPQNVDKELCLTNLSKLVIKNNKYLTKSEYFKMNQPKVKTGVSKKIKKKGSRKTKNKKIKNKKISKNKIKSKKQSQRIKIKTSGTGKQLSTLKVVKNYDITKNTQEAINLDLTRRNRDNQDTSIPKINKNYLFVSNEKNYKKFLQNKKKYFDKQYNQDNNFNSKSYDLISKNSKKIFVKPKSKSCK